MRKIITVAFLFLAFFMHTHLFAQTISIAGTVQNNREVLKNVCMKIKNTNKKYFTDADGRYEVLASKTDSLVVSLKGYEQRTIAVDDQEQVNIILQPKIAYLNKIMQEKVREVEPYAHFIKIEERVINDQDEGYKAARLDYIRNIYYENPKVQSPDQALNNFINYCKTRNLLNNPEAESFIKAARTLGFELITDISPMDMSGYIAASTAYRNIPYTTNRGYSQNLDVFVPKKPQQNPIPCIIFIHDGGWAVHKRAWFEAHARYIASKGFIAVNIDYRMLNEVTPVECVYDAKAAVRWVKANAKKYNIDSNKIGACGASAGAHLAAVLGTTGGIKALDGDGSNLKLSSNIQASVGFATPGLTGRKTWPNMNSNSIPAWFDKVSPYQHITSDDAPMLFVHGSADKTVAVEEPKDLYEKYRSLGIKAKLIIVEGQGHVFYMNTKVVDQAYEFFKEVFESHGAK